MKARKTLFILYALGAYILLQLMWWGYLLVGKEKDGDHATTPSAPMIIGEGMVFLSLMALGFWYIHRSIAHELRLARMEKTFLLSVTHELKTPVAAIKLFLSTLKNRNLTETQVKEILENATQEAQRLQNLTENILLATRIDQEENQIHVQETNLSDLVTRQVERWKKNYPSKFIWETDVSQDIWITGDESLLTSLVGNLLENAVKYGGENKPISTRLFEDEVSIVLRIADSGIGIPDEEKGRVFDKFYRIGNESTRSHKGTGLGLYLVRNIARLHDGAVRIKDNPDGGTIFEIIFAKNQ
ncbi:MAG: hypothetical protein RL220_1171 [Bacteroidota bacterium]